MEPKKIRISDSKSVRSMQINSYLYVDINFFYIYRANRSYSKPKLAVYMNINAVGVEKKLPGLVLVKKIAENVFDYQFPLEIKFIASDYIFTRTKKGCYPPIIISTSDIIIAKTEENISISDNLGDNKDVGLNQNNEFDISSFDNFVNQMLDYIESPMFFIDRDFIDKKLTILPEILYDYLSFFKTSEDERLFLDDWIAKRKWCYEELYDGIKKRYIVKIYNAIIGTIKENLKDDEELVNETPKKNDLSSLFANMSEKDLEKQADEAIKKGDEKMFLRISKEFERRDSKIK